MIVDRLYDSILSSVIHFCIALISFILGLLFIWNDYPPFFSAVLTFALGFIFEYSVMISNHVSGKKHYCKRIRIESFVGWISGLAICLISIIIIISKATTHNETFAILCLVLSAVYLAIIGIEVCFSAKDFMQPDEDIPPVIQK